MAEFILNTNTLPEPLLRMIRSDKIRVRETDGEIRLIPVENKKADCPLLGLYSDGKLTVDKFLKWKSEDRELEG